MERGQAFMSACSSPVRRCQPQLLWYVMISEWKDAKTRLDLSINHTEEQTLLLYLTSFCFCSCVSVLLSPDPTMTSSWIFCAFSLHFLPNLLSFHSFFYQLMLCHLRIVLQFSIYPAPIAHSSLTDTYSHFLNFLTGLGSISLLSFSLCFSFCMCFSLWAGATLNANTVHLLPAHVFLSLRFDLVLRLSIILTHWFQADERQLTLTPIKAPRRDFVSVMSPCTCVWHEERINNTKSYKL